MSKELELLRKTMRLRVRDAGDDVTVPTADLRTVLDELGRLMQSNDRLRRQNKRLRRKNGLGEDDPLPGGEEDFAEEADLGDEDGPA